MHANDYYENFVLKTGLKTSMDSFNKLSQSHEIIFLEGAGSPAEINLQKFDITNMKIAQKTKSPVLLITDIERGGAFASIVGTMELIEKKYLELVKGFIINKFRGDIEILKPGYKKLKQKTGLPVFATIPMTDFEIPDEDSIGNSPKNLNWNASNLKKLDVEINKIAKVVKSSLNIRQVEKLLK
jgi:adenosylcobyric acid synthase